MIHCVYRKREREMFSRQEREVEEVGKRLDAMRTQWNSGALSPHVMTQTTALLKGKTCFIVS